MFWIIATLLVLIGLAFVVYPLITAKQKENTASRIDANRALYRSKMEELEYDLQQGLLDQAEYDSSVEDLQKALLTDVEVEESRELYTSKSLGLILSVVIAIPLAAVLMYKQFSTGSAVANISSQQTQSTQAQTMQASIAKLEQRLLQEPNNGEGWKMLGQSYFVLQQYEKALGAYSKASELADHSDPNIMVLMAEASAFANQELFGEYENKLLSRALQINPSNERALWYAGYAAYTGNKFNDAAEHWGKLITLVPKDRPDVKANLLKFLNSAREKAGMAMMSDEPAAVASDTRRTITVTVTLNEELKTKANPSDTLFIYARAANGPKMPISLARFTVADLPTTVTLTEDMAMMQNLTLSAFDQVQTLARISKSGQAITQPGDLIAEASLVDFTKSPNASVSLTINSIVE